MPHHHFGVSTIGGLADVKILTTDLFLETRNPEIGVSGLSVAYGAPKFHY
jgi:hypothetical protein